MATLVDIEPIYQKVCELEELARDRVIDCPSNSPAYPRYVAQLNERTALKHLLFDAPTIEPKLEWTSIKDDLPKAGQSLLCVGRHGGLFLVKKLRAEDLREEGRIWSYGSGWRWFTYWMELPQLPKCKNESPKCKNDLLEMDGEVNG